MIRKIMFTAGLILFSAQVRAANYYSTGTTSVFTNGATWNNGCSGTALPAGTPAPQSTDTVYICPNTTVTLAAPASIKDIIFWGTGSTLALGVYNLTINGNFTNYNTSVSITGTGAIILSDADHNIQTNIMNGVIPNLTLPNPTVNRTITSSVANGINALTSLDITPLTSIPTTSSGKGFLFNANGTEINFPAGTTIAFCGKVGTVNNLTCTNPAGAAAPAPVSAPIDLIFGKQPQTFAAEVNVK